VASAAAHEDRRALQAVLRDDIGQWTDLKRGHPCHGRVIIGRTWVMEVTRE
jgi:hypothetical protein